MWNNLNITTTVNCSTSEVLAAVRTNLEAHKKTVAEAKQGYLVRAKKLLEEELAQVESGKANRQGLQVHLPGVQDYTAAYVSAARMLEMHQEETIQLKASEFRALVEDEWDWRETFLSSSSEYLALSKRASARNPRA